MSKYWSLVAALLPLVCPAAAAPTDHDVVAQLAVFKLARRADGKPVRVSARNAAPGDILEYRVTYWNKAYAKARGVVGTLSIPANKYSYVADGANSGVLLEASVDGKTFAPVPLLQLVVNDAGQTKMAPIPASEYRYLRWQIGELPARGSITVSARMRVAEPLTVVVTNDVR